MPQISYFYGIIIFMYYADHNPPHIHAVYGGHKAKYGVSGEGLLAGALPKTADRLVKKWIKMRERELVHVWKLAKQRKSPLPAIEPLE